MRAVLDQSDLAASRAVVPCPLNRVALEHAAEGADGAAVGFETVELHLRLENRWACWCRNDDRQGDGFCPTLGSPLGAIGQLFQSPMLQTVDCHQPIVRGELSDREGLDGHVEHHVVHGFPFLADTIKVGDVPSFAVFVSLRPPQPTSGNYYKLYHILNYFTTNLSC